MSHITGASLGKTLRSELPVQQFVDLPGDILHLILLNLPRNDIFNFTLVEKKISIVALGNNLWKLLYQRDFRIPRPMEAFSIKTYKDRLNYLSNIKNGIYASHTITIEPKLFVDSNSIFTTDDGKFFLVSEKTSFSIMHWDLTTGKPLGLFAELTAPIQALVVADKKLLCLHKDRMAITVLDSDGKCLDIVDTKGKELNDEGDDEEEDCIGFFSCAHEKIFFVFGCTKLCTYDLKEKSFLKIFDSGTSFFNLITNFTIADEKIFVFINSNLKSSVIFDLKTKEYKSINSSIDISEYSFSNATDVDGILFVETHLFSPYGSHLFFMDWEGHVHSKLSEAAFEKLSLLTTDGNGKCFFRHKNTFASWNPCPPIPIEIWDFKANEEEVFKTLAYQLTSKTSPFLDIMERFLRMPEHAKGKIYRELCAIIQRDELNYQQITPEEIGQAIEDYMNVVGKTASERKMRQAYCFDVSMPFPPHESGIKWTEKQISEAFEKYLSHLKAKDSELINKCFTA